METKTIIINTHDQLELNMFVEASRHINIVLDFIRQIERDEATGTLALLIVAAMRTKAESGMKKEDFLDMASRLWDGAE